MDSDDDAPPGWETSAAGGDGRRFLGAGWNEALGLPKPKTSLPAAPARESPFADPLAALGCGAGT